MKRKSVLTPEDLTENELKILAEASEGPFYGYRLIEIFGQDAIKNGTVYKRLGVLARHGFLESSVEERRDDSARPSRRFYTLTELGKTAVAEMIPERASQEEKAGESESKEGDQSKAASESTEV